jgi:hypothetical protein
LRVPLLTPESGGLRPRLAKTDAASDLVNER